MFEFNLKKVVLSATAVTALSAGAAAAQEACTNYTVEDGDTMATIAIAAYGTSNYQPIFNANRNVITNPNDLAPGLVLALPCEDGSLPNGQSAQEIIAAEEARAASVKRSSVYQPPIKLVTGNGWAPFADESRMAAAQSPAWALQRCNAAATRVTIRSASWTTGTHTWKHCCRWAHLTCRWRGTCRTAPTVPMSGHGKPKCAAPSSTHQYLSMTSL